MCPLFPCVQLKCKSAYNVLCFNKTTQIVLSHLYFSWFYIFSELCLISKYISTCIVSVYHDIIVSWPMYGDAYRIVKSLQISRPLWQQQIFFSSVPVTVCVWFVFFFCVYSLYHWPNEFILLKRQIYINLMRVMICMWGGSCEKNASQDSIFPPRGFGSLCDQFHCQFSLNSNIKRKNNKALENNWGRGAGRGRGGKTSHKH